MKKMLALVLAIAMLLSLASVARCDYLQDDYCFLHRYNVV